ncbi:putative ATP-dependent RNA helicase DDX11-like protein [Quillaja saponaria]|uniref:ATP-dependent RNA helicase DDX11-like protein n=1 Tax=Quillaja saponaria TaxID=32244 RepID=A0AAD7PPQ7_QUISA|nr:putative ATP-dependent RNA helicase DDX11-like protein [Quillaja saponaria]
MLIRETIQKTKIFFHKTLKNFKILLFGGYQKLPRSLSFHPFSCSSAHRRTYSKDNFYKDLYDEWEAELLSMKKTNNDGILASKKPVIENDASKGSFMQFSKKNPVKNKQEGRAMERNKNTQLGKVEDLCSQKKNGGGHVLAQKIKDLEMMDAGDVEQVLDIEEAIHYYSCLKSPVYQNIVNQFFMDMYSEFSVPEASASINKSKRRLGSIRL